MTQNKIAQSQFTISKKYHLQLASTFLALQAQQKITELILKNK
jgi:hypothetical protein